MNHAHILLLALLGSAALLSTAEPPTPSSTALSKAAATTCRLEVEGSGSGSRSGIKAAKLSCSGGTISAAAHPLLRKALGPNTGTPGVSWSTSEECLNYVEYAKCLFVVCPGTAVTFQRPLLKDVQLPADQMQLGLCITGGSEAVVRSGLFTELSVRSVSVDGKGTSVLISNSTFQGPGASPKGPNAGAVGAMGGRTVITSSRFTGNIAEVGAAIFASGDARVEVDPDYNGKSGGSIFRDNFAINQGGDVFVGKDASVSINGASLQGAAAVNDGGSIFLTGNSTLEFIASSITKASAVERRGGIGMFENSTLVMVRSSVSGCTTGSGAAGGIGAKDTARVVLDRSNVTNNVAGTEAPAGGGGINAAGESSIILMNSRVAGNKAAYGGGLLVMDEATLAIQGTTRITGNTAGKAGGGVYMASSAFDEQQLSAATTKNQAPVARDIMFEAHQIKVLGSNSSLDEFVTSTDSQGGLLHLTLNVTGPQEVPSEEPIKVSLLDEANTTLYTESVRSSQGSDEPGVRVVALKIRQPPGDYILRFEGDGLTGLAAPPVDEPLKIVPCPKGYVTASTGDACIPCVRGYFSFNPYDTECTMCLPNAQCPGGSTLWPKPGFWHSAPQSVQLHKCFNPAACLGSDALNETTTSRRRRLLAVAVNDTDYKTSQCAPPYQGNLCGDCKPGFGKVRAFLCRKCMSKGIIIILYIAAAMAMMALIELLLYFNRSATNITRTDLQQARPEEFLKVLVLHGQWLYIMSNLVGIPWPASLSYPMQVISGLWSSASGTSIGLECVLPHESRVPLGVQKVLLCLLTPAAILCVIVVFEAVWHKFRPRRSVRVKDQLASLVFCIVFLFLPTWLSTAFSLFTCVRLDGKAAPPFQAGAVGSFWVEDMSQLCYRAGGYHMAWAVGLGVPIVVLLCVGMPLSVFVFMWFSRKQGRLNDTVFNRHYGFMYRLWRPEVCWWETILVLQTIGLVIVATFGFSMGPYFQALVTLAVLASVIVLLLWVRPFLCRQANHTAVASACVLFFTAYCALTFLPYDGIDPGQTYRNVMGVVVLLFNMVFLIFTAWKLANSVDWVALKQSMRSALSRGCGGRSFFGQSMDGGVFIESVHHPPTGPREDVPGGKGSGKGKDTAAVLEEPSVQLPK